MSEQNLNVPVLTVSCGKRLHTHETNFLLQVEEDGVDFVAKAALCQ